MMIKDLEMSKELTRDDLRGVRGGSNFGYQGGQWVGSSSLLSIGSPVTAVNAPSQTQTDIRPKTEIELNLASVAQSAFTGILQG